MECTQLPLEAAYNSSPKRSRERALAARSQNARAGFTRSAAPATRPAARCRRARRRLVVARTARVVEHSKQRVALVRTRKIDATARSLRCSQRASNPSLPRAARAGRASRVPLHRHLCAQHRAAGRAARSARPGSAAQALAIEKPCQRRLCADPSKNYLPFFRGTFVGEPPRTARAGGRRGRRSSRRDRRGLQPRRRSVARRRARARGARALRFAHERTRNQPFLGRATPGLRRRTAHAEPTGPPILRSSRGGGPAGGLVRAGRRWLNTRATLLEAAPHKYVLVQN